MAVGGVDYSGRSKLKYINKTFAHCSILAVESFTKTFCQFCNCISHLKMLQFSSIIAML